MKTILIRIFSFVLALLMCFAVVSCAKFPAGSTDTDTSTEKSTTDSTDEEDDTEYTKGMEYMLAEDGKSYILVGRGVAEGENIFIPKTYKGLPVTEIRERAFVTDYEIKNVKIPDSVKVIGKEAFYNCANIIFVALGSGVQTISEKAFYYCSSLMDIVIPASVKSIEDGAFMYCVSMQNFFVMNENTAYGSDNGNLYTKDGKTLIQYAAGKADEKFTLPAYTTTIGKNAFTGASHIKEVVTTHTLKIIREDAFVMCQDLESVFITDTVTVIEKNAFKFNRVLVINCEVTSEPRGWADGWCDEYSQVVWGYVAE